MAPELHLALKKRAQKDGISLNAVCTNAFSSYLGEKGWAAWRQAPVPVQSILEFLNDSLLGLLLFGSFARGEQRDDSDIDILVVVRDDTPLTRALYRRWDAGVSKQSEDRYSPHFVHIPPTMQAAGSIWLEAAIDGIVLYDSDFLVERFLGRVRKAIMDGEFERRLAYGLPYWMKAGQEVNRVQ
jgi:hypothetical protein